MLAFYSSLECVLEIKVEFLAIVILDSLCHLGDRSLHRINNLILACNVLTIQLVFLVSLQLKTLIRLKLIAF